jgi:uncharacterized phiE125 gp8 family phage protein
VRSRIVSITGTPPVSLEEMKNYLKFTQSVTDEDILIESLVKTACEYIEKYTGYSLLEKTIEFYVTSEDLEERKYELPYTPHIEVATVQSEDYKGVLTICVLDTDYYVTGGQRKTIEFYNQTTSLQGDSIQRYFINVTCGFADNNLVPELLKEAIRQQVKIWFDNRGIDSLILSSTVKMLLNEYQQNSSL